MKVGEKKPHLPVFVGSTFADLQLYRRAIRDALAQLEAIVRGMEHFGSKPGRPVDECLRVVASCKASMGILAMRYGSIPDGYDRSMTHLEYDEAQRLELPSLIYMIAEENQRILPKNVETGPGAEKLRELKEQLRKRHVVSFFTTPEDLRARILHDVPKLLKEMGAEISGDLELLEAPSDAEVLQQFEKLPKLFAGEQVTIEVVNNGDCRSAYAEECTALGLEIGASVVARAPCGVLALGRCCSARPVRPYREEVSWSLHAVEGDTTAGLRRFPCPWATGSMRGAVVIHRLRGHGDLLGHGPHEPHQLTGAGDDDWVGRLPADQQSSVALTAPHRGCPAEVLDGFGRLFKPPLEGSPACGGVARGPGPCDQGPMGMGGAGCGHGPLPATLTHRRC
jgi:hypothetical protein